MFVQAWLWRLLKVCDMTCPHRDTVAMQWQSDTNNADRAQDEHADARLSQSPRRPTEP